MSRLAEVARWLSVVGTLFASTQAMAGAQFYPGSNFGAIPDGAGTGPRNYGAPRDIRFEVSGFVGTVLGAGVQFAADHPFVGDLKVSLIAPTGVEHLLFESTGATTPTAAGSPANLVSANAHIFGEGGSNWWTNAGIADANIPASLSRSVLAGPVASPPPAVTSFNTTFANQPANGAWILRFQDGWSGDVGAVTAANLILTETGATRTVTKVADTNDGVCDADCSLREAIASAAPGDLVSFASPFFDTPRAIVLGGTELLINKALAISGPGAHKLTISGNQVSRIFEVDTGAGGRVTLGGLRLTAGNGGDGGAVHLASGSLVIHLCDISGNRAAQGGAVFTNIPAEGIAVYDSCISGNSAINNSGGIAIFGSGPNRLERVTLSNNTTSSPTGALLAAESVTLDSCTLTGNRSNTTTILAIDGVVTLRNTVVGANRGTDLWFMPASAGSFLSEGHNLIGNPGAVTAFNQPGDQTGTAGSPLDPKLGPLSHNGGTVPVHAPLQGSPLLDKGKAIGSDARGVTRAFDLAGIAPATGGNNADIGAVEVAPQVVTNTADAGAGSLRQAIADAPVAPAVSDIWFDPALTVVPTTITLTSGQLSIDRNLAIHGPGAQRLSISGNRQSRVLAVQANRRASIAGLSLIEGNGVGAPNSGEGAGALNAAGSHFSVVDSVLRNNTNGNNFGGAIRDRDGATLVLRNSTLMDNHGVGAIAIGFNAVLIASSSTISRNLVRNAGALFFNAAGGEVSHCTITDNLGNFAYGVEGGPGVSIENSVVARNQSGDLDGASVSRGHNLIGNPRTVTGFTQPGDQVGTPASPLDPGLGPLAIHSGQTPTRMPLAGSPLLDKGLRYGPDQRGRNGSVDIGTIAPATGGNNADIGAVEAQAIIVSNTGDSGAGSLRQAILDANANGPGTDDVLFSLSLPATINLVSRLPQPTGHMNFDGPGANLLTISRGPGAPAFGLLDVFQPVQIGITRIGFTNGLDNGSNGGDNFGGGIDAFTAELHLTEVEISGCQAGSGAGLSLANANGVIRASAITANIAAAQGGGIYFQGDNNQLGISDSTIGSNAADGMGSTGGAIEHAGFGSAPSRSLLDVVSTTIAENSATGGGGIRTGSVAATSTTVTTLHNALLANNTGGNLAINTVIGPGSVLSRGYNLSNTAEALLNQASDRTNVNPQLGILQNNGGNTRSYALLPGSAAIDAGIRAGSVIDQRGSAFARPLDLLIANAAGGDGSDIGAFEVPNTVLSILRASPNPTPPGSSVDFTVNFNASVLGVDASDFVLSTTGVSGAAITAINGSGSSRTVSVSVGTGSGSVRLDLIDNDSITVFALGQPLGGGGVGNGNYTSGEAYTVAVASDQIFRNGFE